MVRLAIIGCGGMAATHRAQFGELGSRLKVTAAVDLDLNRAREAARAVGAPHALADFRQALPYADAVLIALPHHLHHPVGMECLAAGKHVLMEKPLANSERECLDLIAAAQAHKAVLMVGYIMRYHPLVVRLKELIDEGKCGEVFHLSIWTEQYTRVAEGHWAHKAATLGGGQLFSHGCHYIDLLLWYLGNPVEGCHTGTNFGTPWMEREGTSDVFIKFESGAVGYHGGTWGAKGSRLGYAFHAHGTEGMLELDFAKGRLSFHCDGKEETLAESETGMKHAARQMAHFLDCIQKGAKPVTDGPGSLQGLRVIWRLYEAERNRTVADLRGLGLSAPWR
ncbi:MAG: Gfo/Idh/MocA family oxidoreductase [Planctomycetota bacterium]|nr:Gfo/Idh/MocA family oxidoreductase [Planctomycetota bacterium]